MLISGIAQAGPIEVSDPWVRATPPGAQAAALYLTLQAQEEDERLLGGDTDVAREVQVHTHVHQGGMMRMERIDALELPKGQAVTLKPGGDHLMLIGLEGPLVAGATVEVVLRFDRDESLRVVAPVRDAR
jgi:copper(I)-binding protein